MLKEKCNHIDFTIKMALKLNFTVKQVLNFVFLMANSQFESFCFENMHITSG
jgi:hypothetical protein